MAFDINLLRPLTEGALQPSSTGGNQVWGYGFGRSTDSSTQVSNPDAVGFFAGVGKGSRGSNGMGMSVGDLVCVMSNTGATLASTAKVTWHLVIASTANVASTVASSGFNAAYNCTLSAG